MTQVYFIRHAQAGSRDNYDLLSELGRQQAQLLGEHLGAEGLSFSGIYSGTMRRQLLTAEIACEALAKAGRRPPEITADERLNEFNLGAVYRAIAHRLLDEDAEFGRDLEAMQETLKRDPHATGGAVGRCDLAVINAWIENRYDDYHGESWEAFRSRIQSCLELLSNHNSGEAVAVFTSATPIAILAGSAMGLTEQAILRVGGTLYNSGITTMRLNSAGLRLFTLNATPHLPVSLRTFR